MVLAFLRRLPTQAGLSAELDRVLEVLRPTQAGAEAEGDASAARESPMKLDAHWHRLWDSDRKQAMASLLTLTRAVPQLRM